MKIGCSEVPKPSYLPLLWPAEWKMPAPLRFTSLAVCLLKESLALSLLAFLQSPLTVDLLAAKQYGNVYHTLLSFRQPQNIYTWRALASEKSFFANYCSTCWITFICANHCDKLQIVLLDLSLSDCRQCHVHWQGLVLSCPSLALLACQDSWPAKGAATLTRKYYARA